MSFKYKMKYLVVSKKKKIHYSCESGKEKSVPRDLSASLVMLIGDPRDGFLSHPHTHDRFLYYKMEFLEVLFSKACCQFRNENIGITSPRLQLHVQ